MSTVALIELKQYLEVTTDENDTLLQQLLDAAEDEALMFMDRPSLPIRGDMSVDECDSNDTAGATPTTVDSNLAVDTQSNIAPSVRAAIFLLAQGMFEAKDPAELLLIRKASEQKLMPFRNQLGV